MNEAGKGCPARLSETKRVVLWTPHKEVVPRKRERSAVPRVAGGAERGHRI